jgi:hypothetical protein
MQNFLGTRFYWLLLLLLKMAMANLTLIKVLTIEVSQIKRNKASYDYRSFNWQYFIEDQ